MHYGFLGRKYDKESRVYTPTKVAQYLHDVILSVYKPEVILDPCVGTGRLIAPWWEDARIVGIDLVNQDPLCDEFREYPFDLFTTWSLPKPDLVLCNPPFNGTGPTGGMMWPEKFLRKIVELFGLIPVVLFVPHGFRLNQRSHSGRWRWLTEPEAPKITSIISLPLDTFPDVKFHCEILIFNISGLPPHLFLGENYVSEYPST